MTKLVGEVHTLKYPANYVHFGKSHVQVFDVLFEYQMTNNGPMIFVQSLTYTDDKGRSYDSLHLIEEGLGDGIDSTIITSIIGNQEHWDKSDRWW